MKKESSAIFHSHAVQQLLWMGTLRSLTEILYHPASASRRYGFCSDCKFLPFAYSCTKRELPDLLEIRQLSLLYSIVLPKCCQTGFSISKFPYFLRVSDVSFITQIRFCKARLKQFCMGNLVRSILIICILHRISAIWFFVANMLPRQDHHVSAGLPYGSSTNSTFSCQSFLCSDHQVSFCQS